MNENTALENRIITRPFCLIFGALFFTAMVMYTLMSTITEYAADMGSSATVAGLVSGIYIFGGLCSRLYSGNALQTVGWKRLGLIFTGIHGAACIFYFFVDHVVALILVRFIHGIGFGASVNAIVTIGMSLLPQKRFAEACGYFMMGTTLAVGIGPYFGGMVYDSFGSAGCFAMALLFCLLTFLFLLLIDVSEMDPGSGKNRAAQAIKITQSASGIEKFLEIKALPISIATAFTSLGYAAIISFYRLYAEETELIQEFSWFFILYSLLLVFSRPMAGKLQDRYGDKIVCIPGIVAQSTGIFLMAFKPCAITVFLCAIGCALGFGTLNSACNAIACRHAPPERRSHAISTFYICCDAAMGFGPAFLGLFVSSSGGYAPVYHIAAAATLCALPVCLLALREKHPAA